MLLLCCLWTNVKIVKDVTIDNKQETKNILLWVGSSETTRDLYNYIIVYDIVHKYTKVYLVNEIKTPSYLKIPTVRTLILHYVDLILRWVLLKKIFLYLFITDLQDKDNIFSNRNLFLRKGGIYSFLNKVNGKQYIGSAKDLYFRLN
jgi:hypothetical protein